EVEAPLEGGEGAPEVLGGERGGEAGDRGDPGRARGRGSLGRARGEARLVEPAREIGGDPRVAQLGVGEGEEVLAGEGGEAVPVQAWASAWMTTVASEPSPASRVGERKASRGFSMPP